VKEKGWGALMASRKLLKKEHQGPTEFLSKSPMKGKKRGESLKVKNRYQKKEGTLFL